MRGRAHDLTARRLGATAVLPALLFALLLVFQSPPSALAAEPCPNEALRTGFSAALPDCRAYELVTTAQPNNDDIIGGSFTADGSHVAYGTDFEEPGPLSDEGSAWMAERTPAGWVSTGTTLRGAEVEGAGGNINGARPEAYAYSENGSQGVYITVHALNPADTNDALDLYEGSPQTGFTWLTEDAIRGPFYLGEESDMEYEGGSGDLSTVVFQAHQQLLPAAPTSLADDTGREVYEWHEGHLQLVSVLPGETTGAPGGAAVGSGPGNEANLNAVSANGEEVFFESPDSTYSSEEVPTQLYVRLKGERTVEVSAPAPGVVDPEGPKPATYVGATPDGTKVFFTSKGTLTANAETYYDTAEVLYEYNVSTETLTAISSAPAGPEGSRVGLVGISENGEMVYFVTQGVLSGANREGKEPTEYADNLYLYSKGTITFVATLNEADGEFEGGGVWGLANRSKPADVAPNGEHLALISLNNLTEYEAGGDPEMYEYAAESGTITCVSCNPSGAPVGSGVEYAGGSTAFNGTPRFMSDNGAEVIFDTSEPLVPAAGNGKENVYEYEDGHQYLISTGASLGASVFESMSPEGKDALFSTRQRLVPSAEGEEIQLYDARVDGGFPEERTTVVPCKGAECEPSATPPTTFSAPGSTTFAGGENLTSLPPATPLAAKPNPKPAPLTRAQKLVKALKVCKGEKNKKKRADCEKQARRQYGARASKAKKSGKRGDRS